jgi:hypothetical protein
VNPTEVPTIVPRPDSEGLTCGSFFTSVGSDIKSPLF